MNEGPAAPALEETLSRHGEAFVERFGPGGAPRWFVAPGRVNLLGAHLDYNGGPVLPAAIDRGTLVGVRPRTDRRLRFASTVEPGGFEAELAGLPGRTGTWCDYPLGVAHRLMEKLRDGAPSHLLGADVLFGGNLPIGAGLSSSASICVGTAWALSSLWGVDPDPLEVIEAALWAERTFVGVHCGIMDPYAVALARADHLLWLDCKDASHEHLPLPAGTWSIAVADTGVRRTLAQGEFNRRVAECAEAFDRLRPFAPAATCLRDVPREVLEAHAGELPGALARRARHVVEEVARTFRARTALLSGDPTGFGACLTEAHASLRELFEVSIPELDHLVESALEWPGVLGARLTGAGFGGCVVCVLENTAREGFADHLARRFEERFGHPVPVEFFQGGAGPRELEAPRGV